MSARVVAHRYDDPLDRVWLEAARRVGLRVERSDEVYASTDGRGTLTLGVPETLDADDCLAQMIFHELCHSLVEGPESFGAVDWGLDNQSDRDLTREHACLRAQALLAGRYGLRELLAPTTDHRAFYDALPADPLAPMDPPRTPDDGEAIRLARIAVARAERAPWAPHLEDALEATSAIAVVVLPFADPGSLWSRARPRPAPHPSGLPPAAVVRGRCAECAWNREVRGRARCVQAGVRIDPGWPACERFERELDCRSCAACCRDAYDRVEVAARDPFARAHPELVRRVDGRLVLTREGGRCPALEGDGPYACRVYDDRPRTCRDFERGSENCKDARRRLGVAS